MIAMRTIHLLPLLLICALAPAVAGLVAWQADLRRLSVQRLDTDLTRGVDATLVAIDQELTGRLSLLAALAASEELAADPIDIDRFRHDAVRFLSVQQGWASIGLGPYDPAQPTVGGLEAARSDAANIITLTVPLPPAEGRGIALIGRLDLAVLRALLERLPLAPGHTAVVADSAARVLARSRGESASRVLAGDVQEAVALSKETGSVIVVAGDPAHRLAARRSAGGWTVLLMTRQPTASPALPPMVVGAALVVVLLVVSGSILVVENAQRRRRAADAASLAALRAAGDQRLETVAANFPGVIFRRRSSTTGLVSFPFISDGVRSFGLSPGMVDDRAVIRLIDPRDRKLWREVRRTAEAQRTLDVNIRLRDRGGAERWVHVATKASIAEDGATVWDGVVIDVSSTKAAETALRAALDAKQVLLLEVHHRVKNNLQLISSLLRLQQAEFSDPAIRNAFRESLNRVMAMGLIHDLLYDIDGPVSLDFGDYLSALGSKLALIHGCDDRVEVKVEAGSVALALDRAVPLALLANELLSNALKHAFPDRRSGIIQVRLDRAGPMVTLTVRDNGVGLPAVRPDRPTDEARRSGGLGLKIVQSLCAQLNADLIQRSENGTVFAVSFAVGFSSGRTRAET